MTKHGFVHADLEELSFNAWIDPIIFNGICLEQGQPSITKERLEVIVFGLSSYKGHCLTARIFVPKYGAVWDYIPFHLLFQNEKANPAKPLTLKQLCYHNCPDEKIVVQSSSFFKNAIQDSLLCEARFIETDKETGKKHYFSMGITEYLLSVDWYKDNKSGHVVWLKNGQLAMIPNHKLKLETEQNIDIIEPTPSTWRALKDEWIIS